jgi:glycosyltransferase involved in cell wall biosynthesis
MVSVCFVTNELYPLKPGGIGRLMYNFAIDNLDAPTPSDLHYLLPPEPAEQQDAIRDAFAGLGTVHFCSGDFARLGEFGPLLRDLASGGQGAARPSNLDEHLLKSLQYYSGLLEAQAAAELEFDIIEFPDFGGWAAAAQAAKKAGFAFRNSLISVRLHSSFGLITGAEPYYHRPSLWLSALYDMERRALEDADLVVGHLETIADYNAEAYRFSQAWRSRVLTQFPPITLDDPGAAPARATARRQPKDFVFSSRLQPFKRPDTFVRAAVRMLRDDPDCPSLFYIASYGWDQAYIDWLHSLVPVDLRLRIRFLPGLEKEERALLLRRSIVVIPSTYESLCLFAYESAMGGLKVILNRRCAAFGQGPRWRDGANCLMFDGAYIDLARVMREALEWTPTAAVDATPDVPYWETHEPGSRPPAAPPPTLALDVLSYGYASLADLNSDLMAMTGRAADAVARNAGFHVIVPRPALREAGLKGRLPAVPRVHMHLVDAWDVTADDIAVAIEAMSGEAVAFAPSNMAVDAPFIEAALDALSADPTLSAVTSHTLVTGADLEGAPARARLYAGDLLTAAVATTRVCHRASVFRRASINQVGLRAEAGDRWYEDLCARLVDGGHRVLCLPAAPVRERGEAAHSRISDELFFATRANDLGQHLRLPYLLGSLAHTQPGDFRLGEAPARGERPHRHPAAESWPNANFSKVEIVSSKGTERDRYRDIGIRLSALQIKGRVWDSVHFKFGVFDHLPEISFRDQKETIFDGWPPERSDQWGPLIEYCPGSHAAKGKLVADAMLRLSRDDRRRLGSLVRALPAMVKAAEGARGVDHAGWITAAEALLEHWQAEGWE